MSNAFQPYTSEIVTRLIKMGRPQSHAWFTAIHEYIERESGHEVASIHQYILAPERANDERSRILGVIVEALRAGEIDRLSVPPSGD